MNSFTSTFKLAVPIAQGPMGGVSGPRLVAAVAEAGGLGMLPIWSLPKDAAAKRIAATQALTDRPFAVNLRADLVQLEHISAALEAGVEIVHLFWGDPSASLAGIPAHIKIIATVWDEDSTKAALDAGASALIAQGFEAGGHVKGVTDLTELLAQVLLLADDVPVIAAGGLSTAADIRQVMNLGASAALFGTRFAATLESDAHDFYKQALVDAQEGATVNTLCFDGGWPNAPHRVLNNSTHRTWQAAGSLASPERPGEGDEVLHTTAGRSLLRYSIAPPAAGMSGDLEGAAMYAGTGVAEIHDLPSVAELLAEFQAELLAGQ